MPLTYKQAIKIAKDFGYTFVSQQGSHKKFISPNNYPLIIPEHKELKPGTANNIIKLISQQTATPKKDIILSYNIKL